MLRLFTHICRKLKAKNSIDTDSVPAFSVVLPTVADKMASRARCQRLWQPRLLQTQVD